MRVSPGRLLVGAILALSLATLGLQAVVLRPHLWPAGAGLAVAGDTVMTTLSAPKPIAIIRPPSIRGLAGTPLTVVDTFPGGPAERAGIARDEKIVSVLDTTGTPIALDTGLPSNPVDTLKLWREMAHLSPEAPITLGIQSASGAPREIALDRPSVWNTDSATRSIWLRHHLGPLSQTAAFLAGAAVLLFLGAAGSTATLMMLALIATAVANAGPLMGSEMTVPLIGPLLLFFHWLVTPLSFPVIGLAVLYFPSRAETLDRHKWIVPALAVVALPMLIVSLITATFLLGADSMAPAAAWVAERSWVFDASYALALAANVLIVVEGIGRYRSNPDADERRRIQIVVYTGVPAVFAYALKTGIPLIEGLIAGHEMQLPWLIELVLQAIVLLPAFGLPYAVAVRHVFSPRTVLRRSLQYAFARQTLTALVVVPVIALIASVVQQRDQSVGMIVSARPLFYLTILVVLGLVLRYRDSAQRWLDQRFFRTEYDAREILVSLASRVPYEPDPRNLVTMVVNQIDTALHPESVSVLAENMNLFEPVSSVRVEATPLTADSGVVTLLKWSDKPLEVFLDDEQSPVARVPPADRMWLAAMKTALLVPIFAGGSDPRPFVGLIALGRKRSEEPYTPEDRDLLRGIAVQMGVALDLSRLRRKAGESQLLAGQVSSAMTSDSAATIVRQPTPAGASIGVGAVIDGKYRVDAVIGQGGMGAVYRAWDTRLERPIAIKVVRADMLSSADAHARFQRESLIVAKLQHPAIVTVFDYGTLADGAAFLVMEFVPGEDLRQMLKREKKLTSAKIHALMTGIAGGVDAAHQLGIYHRDLKPENILLPASGTGPKVVDFGVAKLSMSAGGEGGTQSVSGTIVGTPAYMAPEQLRGDAVDGRADVYSLGAMVYEMVTGKLPYGGGSFVDIGIKQSAGEKTVDTGEMPAALADVIRRAVAYDRERRPTSAGEFAKEIAGAIS